MLTGAPWDWILSCSCYEACFSYATPKDYQECYFLFSISVLPVFTSLPCSYVTTTVNYCIIVLKYAEPKPPDGLPQDL